MTGKRRFSADELSWLEANCALPIGEYSAGFAEQFRQVKPVSLKELRKRKGWKTGRDGRFVKGHQHRFRPGFMNGTKHEYKAIGAESVSSDGYRIVKVCERCVGDSGWRYLHRVKWESAHGSIPPNTVLKCKGDKADTDPSNWEMLPRSIMPSVNDFYKQRVAYDDAPAELKPTILAVARLDSQMRAVRRGRERGAQ